MRKKCNHLLITIWIGIMLAAVQPGVAGASSRPATPNNPVTQKWRIGYCESESFVNYAGTLYALLEGLHELGWMERPDGSGYRPGQQDTAGMWRWLSSREISPRIEFVRDAYFSLASLSEKDYPQITERLQKEKIDLVLAMGTQAGKFLANDAHHIRVMVFSASNAVQSGIVKSATDSGEDYVWAHLDPQRFARQLEVFHDSFKFGRLGLVYQNSPTAYSYSAIDQVEAAARRQGFAIDRIYVDEPKNAFDQERYRAALAQAYLQLSHSVDAMYLTVAAIDRRWLPHLLTPFYVRKIPVFSQLGADEVEFGALMSVSSVDFKNLGRFGAQNMVRAFEGASLRFLPQVFESTPKIIVNLEAARKTGYRFPFAVLLSADQVFPKIGEP